MMVDNPFVPGAAGLTGGGGGLGGFFNANPTAFMGGVAGAGLGAVLGKFLPTENVPYTPQLTGVAKTAGQQAGQLSAEAQTFLQPLQGGSLPPALEAQVQQVTNDAIASMKSQYANLGLSRSTMTADEEAYIGLQSEALRGKLAQEMASIGTSLISSATSDLQVQGQVYQSLMQAQIASDAASQQSFSSFMGALGMASSALPFGKIFGALGGGSGSAIGATDAMGNVIGAESVGASGVLGDLGTVAELGAFLV